MPDRGTEWSLKTELPMISHGTIEKWSKIEMRKGEKYVFCITILEDKISLLGNSYEGLFVILLRTGIVFPV